MFKEENYINSIVSYDIIKLALKTKDWKTLGVDVEVAEFVLKSKDVVDFCFNMIDFNEDVDKMNRLFIGKMTFYQLEKLCHRCESEKERGSIIKFIIGAANQDHLLKICNKLSLYPFRNRMVRSFPNLVELMFKHYDEKRITYCYSSIILYCSKQKRKRFCKMWVIYALKYKYFGVAKKVQSEIEHLKIKIVIDVDCGIDFSDVNVVWFAVGYIVDKKRLYELMVDNDLLEPMQIVCHKWNSFFDVSTHFIQSLIKRAKSSRMVKALLVHCGRVNLYNTPKINPEIVKKLHSKYGCNNNNIYTCWWRESYISSGSKNIKYRLDFRSY
jgi:hypothetical protein